MAIPVTTIGGDRDDDHPSGDQPAAVAPSFMPATIKPTAMPGGQKLPEAAIQVVPEQPLMRPTTLPFQDTAVKPAAPSQMPPVSTGLGSGIRASGIGGAPVIDAVPLDSLAHRFPDANSDVLARTSAILLAHGTQSAVRVAWLSFGLTEQSTINATLKDQVTLLESPGRRNATAHVARLQEILTDVLSSMEGGFFRKSAHAVWQQHSPEIRQLETLLDSSANDIQRILFGISNLKRRYAAGVEALVPRQLAGLYLLDGMANDPSAHLLQSRLAALTASQALAEENRLLLEHQEGGLQELALLIQDGVLVKLPSVVTQIAALPDKPTDTDRYLAREALSNLTQLFDRTQTWH